MAGSSGVTFSYKDRRWRGRRLDWTTRMCYKEIGKHCFPSIYFIAFRIVIFTIFTILLGCIASLVSFAIKHPLLFTWYDGEAPSHGAGRE